MLIELKTNKTYSKEIAADVAQSIVADAEEGFLGATDVLVFAKYLEEVAKALKTDKIKEAAVEEVGKGVDSSMGATFKISESGHRYDYSHTPIHAATKDKLKQIETIAKAGGIFSDPDTGEMVQLVKPIHYSTTTVQVSLPKIA